MKCLNTWTLIVASCWACVADAQLELVPASESQSVFGGGEQKISVLWHNAGGKTVASDILARKFQTSSATVIPLGEPQNWKNLQVLPGQTVLESIRLAFPPVKAGTHFLVQWLDESSKVLGKTEVMVYPTNLLQELKPLAGKSPIGVFDPQNQLKPLFKILGLEFEDLEDAGLNRFSGKLAIIGPFESKARMREGLVAQINALAKKNVAMVWLQPPPESRDKLQPSFYTVSRQQTGVVIVQPELVADLPENPQSQLNLIYFCQLALNPPPLTLPGLSAQP